MDCPVCRYAAQNITTPRYRGLMIACHRCGSFRVTENAVAAMADLKVEHRLAALERARTLILSDPVPTITTGCLGLAGSHQSRRHRHLDQERPVPLPKPRTFSRRPRSGDLA